MALQKMYMFRFKVLGSGPFPVDMLRYDRCWPADQKDVTVAFGSGEPRPRLPQRVVELKMTSVSKNGPTDGRWNSFGWSVQEIKEL